MKIGDLVKYKEPYSKYAYLRKRGMGVVIETDKKESRVSFFRDDGYRAAIWVANNWLKVTG